MPYLKQNTKPVFLAKQPSQKQSYQDNSAEIPKDLRNNLEQMSGISFEDVRVHYTSPRPAAINALAYAQGNHIYLGPGQEQHLPHELGHVLQQKQGRVQSSVQIGAMQVNRDASLEGEADRLGMQALQLQHEGSGKTGETMQLRKGNGENTILQLAGHVNFGNGMNRIPQAGGQAPNPPAVQGKPTIYYESFGDNRAQLLEVYRQSCRYSGRTVCILGLNKKNGRPTDADLVRSMNSLRNDIIAEYQNGHDACLVAFTWTETEEEGGYTFPYFEVRSKLMSIAEGLAAGEEKVLFRWIDRDAADDTTEQTRGLQGLAINEKPAVYTGAYDWDTSQWSGGAEGSLEKKKLDVFYALNRCERELRAYYWKLHRSLAQHGQEAFYIPEPVLLMNKSAHTAMRENLLQRIAEREASGNPNAGQQKESMTALGGAHKALTAKDLEMRRNQNANQAGNQNGNQARNRNANQAGNRGPSVHIVYKKDFSVTKPDKRRRLPNGGETSYLQELENLVERYFNRGGREQNWFHLLVGVLQNLRQSAFDDGQWSFTSDAAHSHWEQQKKSELSNQKFHSGEELQAAFNWRRLELAVRLLKVLAS